MNTDVSVGVAKSYSLEDLAADAVWRFREAIYPVIGSGEIRLQTYMLFGSLARLNGAGFLTYASQPACFDLIVDGDHVDQRAYVSGYTTAEKAAWIVAACENVLECHVTPVGALTDGPRRVTPTRRYAGTEDNVAGTWHSLPRVVHDDNVYVCTDAAQADIEKAMAVTVIDPVWGRDWFLWETLIHALR